MRKRSLSVISRKFWCKSVHWKLWHIPTRWLASRHMLANAAVDVSSVVSFSRDLTQLRLDGSVGRPLSLIHI